MRFEAVEIDEQQRHHALPASAWVSETRKRSRSNVRLGRALSADRGWLEQQPRGSGDGVGHVVERQHHAVGPAADRRGQ